MNNSNVVLINPKIPANSQNKKVNAIVGITFPSSLGVLSSALMKQDISIEIHDEQIEDVSVPVLVDGMLEPKIIGISTWTINASRAYELAIEIKEYDENVVVVLGGIHPTVLPDEVIMAPGVDIAVRGEAEYSFTELVQCILGKKEYKHIAGLTYIEDGKIIHNKSSKLVENLDDIPPFPYEKFDKYLDKYPAFSSVMGSRGCPYKCTFCSARSISGTKYRYNSVERMIYEIKILVRKYKQKSIFFMDDNIGVKRSHFYKLCDAIIAEGLHKEAYFHGSMRGDNATYDVLQKAKEANFKILYYGMETGVERLMKIVDKGETVQEVIDAVYRAEEVGIAIGTTIIFGLPTETRDDRYETMKLVKSLPIQSVRYNTLTPYPGTPAYDVASKSGLIRKKDGWMNFGVQYMWESDDIPYVPVTSRRLELIWDTMYANVSTYLTPKGVWKLLVSPVAGGNVIRLKSRWYLSFKELYKMYSAFFYLISRFANITVRMTIGMMKK